MAQGNFTDGSVMAQNPIVASRQLRINLQGTRARLHLLVYIFLWKIKVQCVKLRNNPTNSSTGCSAGA